MPQHRPAPVHFTHAIVRPPGAALVNALTTAGLGRPDVPRARQQHAAHVAALRDCGLTVIELAADDALADGTFVEDTALLTRCGAVITRPGAPSRRGETASIGQAIAPWYPAPSVIEAPGTVDGGDVLMVGDHLFIGLSGRTNPQGAQQLTDILASLGLSASTVPVPAGLHLKSSVSYLEHGRLLVDPALAGEPQFAEYERLVVPAGEGYAANAVWINGTVLMAAGFPGTRRLVEAAGYETRLLDVGEFARADGGLSCLSLRFTPASAAC